MITLGLVALASCAGVVIKGVGTASEQVTISNNQDAADKGNAEAQFKVGSAHCCRIGKTDVAHDNQKATDYLCRSAHQGYTKAQYLLGRIYAGHPIEGFNPQQTIKLQVVGGEKNLPLAIMWLSLVIEHQDEQVKDARDELNDINKIASAQDQAKAKQWMTNWQQAPCQWNDVFPPG